MRDIRYTSELGKVVLEFVADEDNKKVMFEYMTYQPNHIKIFMITLKKAIDDFTKNGFEKIQQRVTYNDWNECLAKDSRWNVLTDDTITQTYVIECNTVDAMDCIANGFGITKNGTNYKTV